MSDDGREAILQNIRRGVNNPELMADRKRQIPATPPATFEPRELVSRWRSELEVLTGHVYGPLSPVAAMAQLIELLSRRQPKTVLAWDDAHLPLPNVSARLQAAGISVRQMDASATKPAMRQELEQIPVGLTGAIAGLADTGSLIVDTAAGRSRSASLLPPIHVALLRVDDLYPDLPTWMARQGSPLLANVANLTIISGPSRTADIELNLVLGVHGPGEVHVILLT